MALGSVVGAAVRRPEAEDWPDGNALRATVPQAHRYAPAEPGFGPCPEIDCVRHMLPRRVTAAAERRAQSVGVGAERVLICADAITEEAYLTALANWLGTSYERFDGVSRADCPLDDDRLIEAAAAGLLPLRQHGGLVWVIAPRGMTARQLADPRRVRPEWLRSFRLTSADRLRQFAMRHSQRALGQRATESLRRTRPLFSNAPASQAGRRAKAFALAMLAFAFFVVAPVAMIEAMGGLLCVLFLASAILRVWSACFADEASWSPAHGDDFKLPEIGPDATDQAVFSLMAVALRGNDRVSDLSDG